MSQQPIWLTAEGSLGTVPEGQYYNVSLVAYDPDFPDDPTQITYSLIAGELPDGVAVSRYGTIEGIPVSIADFKGVPQEVSENTESKFTIRATTESNRINDRTFTLTVTGQDIPEWVTPAGLIAGFFDGDKVEFQFVVTDDDPNDTVIIEQLSGTLPLGTTLDENGLLTGYIEPTPTVDSAFIGFDTDGAFFDAYPFDFAERSINKNYQFTLQVTDGKAVNIRTFQIYVLSRDSMSADTDLFTADSGIITADSVASRQPYLLEYIPDFGTIKHDNFFAYQFQGFDPDEEQVFYTVEDVNTLPKNLVLDYNTGWLSGYLPNVNLVEVLDEFNIILVTSDPLAATSIPYSFTFTTVGEVETEILWTTPEDLGTIDNGDISTLYVEAVHQNTVLNYRLKPGLYNKLPQGLTLLTSGNIAGRVSFKTFSLDNGATTFDADFETRLDVNEAETTFDSTFVFNVEAYSSDGFVSVTKQFFITVNREYDTPQNILYAKAMPPADDRTIINDLLLNKNIMTPELMYRGDDPYFGVAKHVTYTHALGLSPASIEDYFAAFDKNHYYKQVTLGEISTARALDDDGNIIYEVVYSNIIDDLVNPAGVSVSAEIDLTVDAVHVGIDGSVYEDITTVYPNSLENMRNRVIDEIGQISKVLPRWMLSKQEDGRILGFTPAWVIAYTKPGQSKLVAYRIENDFDESLNKIDFTIDRFTLDSRLTDDWTLCDEVVGADNTDVTSDTDMYTADLEDVCDEGWTEGIMTTFDRQDYVTGDDTTRTADLITITADGDSGSSSSTETIFDGGSCRFVSPVDEYESSDRYNRYIMFPQVEIIDNSAVV